MLQRYALYRNDDLWNWIRNPLPSINALLVENTTDDNRGKAFGLFYAFFSLGVVAGSFTVGAIGASPSISFIIGTAFLLTFAGMIYVRSKVKRQ